MLIKELTLNDGTELINVPADIKTLEEFGVPAADIDTLLTEARNSERLSRVKIECRNRIYAVASVETQMNMAAASAVISGKSVSSRTEEEKAILAGAEMAIAWIAAMRTNITTLADNPDAPITSGDSWPECPLKVQAIAAQF